MQTDRIAIIDLGTNTFNLLIAEVSQEKMKEIYFEKIPVKLGKGGILKGLITPEARQRALEALIYYKGITDRYHVREILAYGTAALRGASNNKELTDQVRQTTGINIRIISGDEEASLIYTGVTHSLRPQGNFLIMDIGGGSVEFILASDQGVLWKHSYPLGVARLLEEFNPSDPITTADIKTLENHLDRSLKRLWEETSATPPGLLIGAAGTFDTLRAMAVGKEWLQPTQDSWQEIPLGVYQKVHQMILRSDTNQRKKMKGLEPFRVEMIVPASVFINFVIHKIKLSSLIQSYYSLKEGAVFRWIEAHYGL